jgi:predicted SnoaL-like aldol condensation-catalyzing enzyme
MILRALRRKDSKSTASLNQAVLHPHSFRRLKVQCAIIEIFRLENGKIDKHWDVIQGVPETSTNINGMF